MNNTFTTTIDIDDFGYFVGDGDCRVQLSLEDIKAL
jgi:hypothetical protein